MGMYDVITVKVPLPGPQNQIPENLKFQTKSLMNGLYDYELREDGTLWRETCRYEDHSDPDAEGVHRLIGMMTPVDCEWLPVTDFIGEVRFYHYDWDSKAKKVLANIEYSAYFVGGQLKELHKVESQYE